MNGFIEKLTGLAPLTDQVIATDLLSALKSSIKNYSLAITETATKEVREILKQHLEDAIDLHEKMTNYMVNKGYYEPYDTEKQFQIDIKTAETALNLTK